MNEVFKIKIKKDSNNDNIDLENISIEAAESLKLFIDSMTMFCENYTEEEKSKVKFSIREGSLEYITSVEKETKIYEDIEIILTGINDNNFSRFQNIENISQKIKHFRSIQNKIISNGLDYSIKYLGGRDQFIDISTEIKNNKIKFQNKYNYSCELVFIKGVLYEVGGKSITNIHLLDNDIEFKIDTNREQAYKFSSFLYKQVYVSALKIESNNPNKDIEFELVDQYLSEDTFNFYKDIYTSILSSELSEKCEIIYSYLETNFKEEKIGDNIKFLRLFNNTSISRGLLRFLLLSTKNHLNINEKLDELYYSLSIILNKK